MAQIDSKAPVSRTFKLDSIPKLDKTQFIASFVDSQKLHARAYAEEGRNLWQQVHTITSKPNQVYQENLIGFTTPVLTARNIKSSSSPHKKDRSDVEAVHNSDAEPEKLPKARAKTKPKIHSPAEISRKIQLSANDSTTTEQKIKKRTAKPSDDDETVARLAERRERKRAKREIVRRKDSDIICQPEPSKDKKKKARALTKAPALALMHGFSATNVGKNRLTAPPPVVGVFNKGKASVKTKVSNKTDNKESKSLAFSESRFLQKTIQGQGPIKSRSKPPESDTTLSSGEESTSTSSQPTKKHVQTKRTAACLTKERSSGSDSASSDKDVDCATREKPCANSEAWDIERDGYALPSDGSSISIVAMDQRRSVVLDTQALSWSKKKSEDAEAEQELERPGTHSAVSSSLAPSQSASQHGLPRPAAPPVAQALTASRYFATQQTDLHPMESRLPERVLASGPAQAQSKPTLRPKTFESPDEETPSDCFIDQISLYHGESETKDSPPPPSLYTPVEESPELFAPTYITPIDAYLDDCEEPLMFSDPAYLDVMVEAKSVPSFDIRSDPGFASEDIAFDDSYARDCYIPPRVDAPPPSWIDQSYTEAANSGDWLNENGLDFAEWSPDQDCTVEPMTFGDYTNDDGSYLETGEFPPYPHQLDSGYAGQVFGPDWEYETPLYIESQSDEEFEVSEVEGPGTYDVDEKTELLGTLSEVCSGSEIGDTSVVEGVPSFLQGRELLLGLSGGRGGQRTGYVSVAEADVARNIKGHWLPQRL